MSARSLNKAMLIGNLTRDPNVRFTPTGTAVCNMGLATNRTWSNDAGEKKEQADYHNLVAWGKLAEICGDLLRTGSKIYVEGRLQTRKWQTKDGQDRQTTEIVVSDMMLLSQAKGGSNQGSYGDDQGNESYSDDSQYQSDDVSDVEDVSDDIPF